MRITLSWVAIAITLAFIGASAVGCAARSHQLALEQGELALTLGDPEEAADAFHRALEYKPRDPEALHGLARSYIARADAEAALEIFAGLEHSEPAYFQSRATPDYLLALLASAETRLSRSDPRGGLRLARRLRAIDPDYRGADHLFLRALVAEGARLREAHRWRQAEKIYREALEFDASHVEAVLGLSEALIGEGRVDEAIRMLSDASLQHPEDARISALMDRAIEIRYPISPAKHS